MVDTAATTPSIPDAGDIWLDLEREERTYHLNEEEADQRRRVEFVDAQIRKIIGRRTNSSDHERK